MKTLRYIIGILLSLISFGIIILTMQKTCDFDPAHLEGQGALLILASILFFVFILTATLKSRKWQGTTIIILSALTGLFTFINVGFNQMETQQSIPMFIIVIFLLLFGISINQTIKTKEKIQK